MPCLCGCLQLESSRKLFTLRLHLRWLSCLESELLDTLIEWSGDHLVSLWYHNHAPMAVIHTHTWLNPDFVRRSSISLSSTIEARPSRDTNGVSHSLSLAWQVKNAADARILSQRLYSRIIG